MSFGISKRDMLARSLDMTGCGRILRAASVWSGVLVLNYHRIGDRYSSLLDRNLWSATVADFDAQIAMISRNFDPIGLTDFNSALTRRRGRHVMITFDDGYRDNYIEAFPVLKKHGVSATFFITTGFLDVPMVPWWDEIAWMVRTSPCRGIGVNPWTTTPVEFDFPHRELAINRLLALYKAMDGSKTQDYLKFLADALETGRCPVAIARELWMTWEMIREMRQQGMAFGGHTVTHPVLANITAEEQYREIQTCRHRLVEELGEPVDAFSYPVGGPRAFNRTTQESVVRSGFNRAFTFIRGYCRPGKHDCLAIPRTAIETDIDMAHFRAITTLPQIFT